MAERAVALRAWARLVARVDVVLLALAAANVGWLLASIGRLVPGLYLNADIASAPVIGSLIANAPLGRVVTLGNYPYYESVWFMELTRGLPLHRQLWEAAPFAVAAVTLALVVWMAWRAIGPRAAVITGVVLCCTTPGMRFVLLTPDAHGAALFHGVLLGAALVFANRRAVPISTPALLAGALVLAAITATGVTDRLLDIDSLVPFVVTACFGWWRTQRAAQRMIALVALDVAGLAVVVGELGQRAMQQAHVVPTPFFRLSFVPANLLLPNGESFLAAFSYLGGGDFFGAPISGRALLSHAAGVLTLTAGAAVVGWCWRAVPKLIAPPTRSLPNEVLVRETYLVFWATTLLCTVAAYILTNAEQVVSTSRYLVAAFVAVVALLPALAPTTRRAQYLLAAGVGAFALLALRANVAEDGYANGVPVTTAETQQLVRYAREQRLVYGYADYATAPVLTWATGLRVQVFPVQPCGKEFCAYGLNTISSWYTPRPGVRTFLVIAEATQHSSQGVSHPSAAFGRPTTTAHFEGLTIYVYDHDIAAQLGPWYLANTPRIEPGYPLQPG